MTITEPAPQSTGARAIGHIAQIIGPVVDVEFPAEQLPEIYHALELDLSRLGWHGRRRRRRSRGR